MVGDKKSKDDLNKEKLLKKFTKKELFLKSLQFSTKNWKSDAYYQVLTLVVNIDSFVSPYLYGKIIDAISKDKNIDDLYYYFQMYFFILLLQNMFRTVMQGCYNTWIADSGEDMSSVMLENILFKDYEFFDHFKSGELIKRINESMSTLNFNFLDRIFAYFQMFGKLAVSLTLMVNFSFSLTVIYFTSELIKHSLDFYYKYRNKKAGREEEFARGDRNANCLNEIISSIRHIKAFSTEKKELMRFRKHREEIENSSNFYTSDSVFEINYILGDLMGLVRESSKIILLFAAGKKAIEGEITYGEFTSFLTYTKQITSEIYEIKDIFSELSKKFNSWQRFFEIYDYQPKVKTGDGVKLENLKGEITFEDVTFAYPTKPEVNVMENFSIKIEEGQVIALVGSSGSGKSTLSSLVQRFYNPNKGKVKIDGVDIEEIDPASLHKNMGYVSQEPVLYSGTIEENISYAVDSYTKEDLDRVAKLANAYDFIHDKNQFPDGYNTLVGERGVKVSGGQKQRIAIARALLKNARILIFDEATSALDAESEHEVQEAIDNIVKAGNITTIIIAHRLSTVKNADKIYVMDKGKIVEEGRHKELLKENGFYKQLVQRQLEENSLSRENSLNK